MLSGILKILFLFSFSVSVFGSIEICYGRNLSAEFNSEVDGLYAMLNQTPCTHVIGDIFLANLSDVSLPVEIYRRVRKVHGSIIIVNNTNIDSPIIFPSLRTINATLLPAITIAGNEKIVFAVGDQFRKAISNHTYGIMFAVLENKKFHLDTAQYNLWYLAGYPNSKFAIDSGLSARVCGENFFKPIAGILGFLFVALTVAFSTVAFYDRPKKL